jgi:hypothetical protein
VDRLKRGCFSPELDHYLAYTPLRVGVNQAAWGKAEQHECLHAHRGSISDSKV